MHVYMCVCMYGDVVSYLTEGTEDKDVGIHICVCMYACICRIPFVEIR